MAWINHATYLAISAVFTVVVGRSLFHHGRPFLLDCFPTERVADAINRLLLVGFYLINTAFVLFVLRFGDIGVTAEEMIESISFRVGVVSLTMGVLHFHNLYWCQQFRAVYSLSKHKP